MKTTTRSVATALLLLCTAAAAQGRDMREEMRKRMQEISRLMRESESRLLEITRIDRLVARQQEIVRKLKELEPPPRDRAAAARNREREEEIRKLRQGQADVARKLREMFRSQEQSAQQSLQELRQLLKNWPRGQSRQGGQRGSKSKAESERERRLRERREELRQRDPRRPRDDRDRQRKRDRGRRPKSPTENPRAIRFVEAWVASLPPADQERINRGDFSKIPMRYRRLVREYTALRAKREAEEKPSDNR